MLPGDTRTGTAGYGSRTDLPAGLDSCCSPAVAADERDGGRGTLDRTAARLPFRAIADSDLIVAPAGCGGDLRLPGCLFAPGSPGVTAPLASLPSSAAPRRWPERHRGAETAQYCSIWGITAVSWRRCARAGYGPRDLRSVRTMRPVRLPTDCLCAPAGQQHVGCLREGDRLRQPADLPGGPGRVTVGAPAVCIRSGAWLMTARRLRAMPGYPPSPPHTPGAHRPPARAAALTVPALLIAATASWMQQLSAVTARPRTLSSPHREPAFPHGGEDTSCILRNAQQSYPQSVDGCGDKLQLCNQP